MTTPNAGSAAGIDLAGVTRYSVEALIDGSGNATFRADAAGEYVSLADVQAALARATPQPSATLPSVFGVSRDAESPGGKGVLVSFHRALTDDELRTLHEALAGRTPQPSADRAPADGAGELNPLAPAVFALDAAIHKILIAGDDSGDELSDTSLRNTLEEAQRVAYRALIGIGIERLPGAVNPLSAFLKVDRAPTAGDSATPQHSVAEQANAEEAAKLQTLLMTEFDCYRTAQGGLYAWAMNALLDNSPHRLAQPLASTAASEQQAGADELPPLPEPKYAADDLTDIFTADQMRAYARAALTHRATTAREWNAGVEAAAKEADHWQQINGSHKCGQYIAGAIRGLKRATTAADQQDAAQAQTGETIPEQRNIFAVERHGDQSAIVVFRSCRAASAFMTAVCAAMAAPTSGGEK